MTIHYHDEGSGFPIVWIHGFPLSSAMFEPQLGIHGFRHIRVDLPGFGSTPPPASPPSMATYARDVIGVLDACGIRDAVIAGFSMGGYIAMQLLRDVPERFASMMLLDTRETADTAEGREARLRQLEEVRQSGSIQGVVDSMLPKMVLGDAMQPAVRKIMESATPGGVIGALGAMASRPDSTETLKKANVPTLVVVGDRDPITPPTDAERMTAMIARAEMAPIAKAAHMANFERPEQLNPLIAAFLTRYVLHHE